MKMQPLTIRLPQNQYQELTKATKEKGINIVTLIRLLVARYLAGEIEVKF